LATLQLISPVQDSNYFCASWLTNKSLLNFEIMFVLDADSYSVYYLGRGVSDPPTRMMVFSTIARLSSLRPDTDYFVGVTAYRDENKIAESPIMFKTSKKKKFFIVSKACFPKKSFSNSKMFDNASIKIN